MFPNKHFKSIFEITPDFLHKENISALILDIDNTLVTYGTAEPTSDVRAWIDTMRSAGIDVAIASNNKKARVDLFCRSLDVFYTYKSAKPMPKCVKLACKSFGKKPSDVAVVGDLIFTDVLCARFSGATAFHVTPLVSPESTFIKLKRILEKPILSMYKKRHPDEFEEDIQ